MFDKSGEIKYNFASMKSHSITEQRPHTILKTARITTLDEVFKDRQYLPTFIKLDIEGAEYQCLEGGKNIIAKNKPKLAICAYHKPDDYITLPQKILEINPEYKLYMRHFIANNLDSIIFAI